MPKPPIDLTKHAEYQRRQRERQAVRERQLEEDAELGRQAFKSFLEHRGKLTPRDREAIARNMYRDVEDYYSNHPDEERYILLKDAGLTDENSTRVLPRLVLRPDEPAGANNELYASPEKYRWLIEAIARRSGESVNALAGRILIGSSFCPNKAEIPLPNISEAHLILSALQKAADKIDQEFHLFEQCMEVARFRDERESGYWSHLQQTGEELNYESWQEKNPALMQPSPSGPEHALSIGQHNGLWWPLDPDYLIERTGPREGKRIVPVNAYWAKSDAPSDPYSAGILSGADFFYFPHIYLGSALCWGKTPRSYWSDFDCIYDDIPGMRMPCACWNERRGAYEIREDHGDDLALNLAHWLVIYPDPFLKRLVPMLYALGHSSGAQLTQLTVAEIANLGNPERWQYFGTDAPTLLQRLRDLTGYRSGNFAVYESWRETAGRFHLNPALRRHSEVMDEIRYRKHLERWIGQHTTPADRSDDDE